VWSHHKTYIHLLQEDHNPAGQRELERIWSAYEKEQINSNPKRMHLAKCMQHFLGVELVIEKVRPLVS
jgi:hypothetical protein